MFPGFAAEEDIVLFLGEFQLRIAVYGACCMLGDRSHYAFRLANAHLYRHRNRYMSKDAKDEYVYT